MGITMKKNGVQGFTLIEVILSLAIFSVISVGFLGMFSMVYINTFKSTVVTENAFLAQRQIEDEIALVKSDLEKGIVPAGHTSSTVTLFTGTNLRNVVVYHLIQNVTSDQVIDTIVAQSRPPQLQTPTIIGGVTIAAYSGTTKKDYPNIGMPSLSLDLGAALVVDNPGLLIRYLYYWYISNPGYYIPSSPPTFPDDYQIIPEHTTSLIGTIPETYAGKFIKLVVTPVGEKGQMGTSVESNAVYISSMPLNDNLIFHLDASYINPTDTTQVRALSAVNYIKKWIDISPSLANPVQATSTSQPVVFQYTIGTGVTERNIFGTLGAIGGTNMSLNTTTTPNIGTKLNMTVYFTAKFDDALAPGFTIFQSKATALAGNRWILATDANDKLILTRYLADTTVANTWTFTNPDDVNYRDSKWHVFKLEIWQNKLSIKIDGVDAGSASFANTAQTMQFTDFKISYDQNLSIAEVAVFDTIQLDGSTQSDAMYTYLNAKYRP
jgi:prepilin-type N-terminal cleavage/methylation domain-containing protein